MIIETTTVVMIGVAWLLFGAANVGDDTVSDPAPTQPAPEEGEWVWDQWRGGLFPITYSRGLTRCRLALQVWTGTRKYRIVSQEGSDLQNNTITQVLPGEYDTPQEAQSAAATWLESQGLDAPNTIPSRRSTESPADDTPASGEKENSASTSSDTVVSGTPTDFRRMQGTYRI